MKTPKYGTGFSFFKNGIKQTLPEPDVLFHWEYFETISGKHDHLFGVKTGNHNHVGVKSRVLTARRAHEWERLTKEGSLTSGPAPRASYDAIKSMLPWCLPQGQIEARRSPGQSWAQVGQVPSGLFNVDIDAKDNRDCPAVLAAGIDPADYTLAADLARIGIIRESILRAQAQGRLPYLVDLALSPSAIGLKGNTLVPKVSADDTVFWRTLHAWLGTSFLEEAGIRIDPAVKSMWPCYLTYDEGARLFTGATPIELNSAVLAVARENAQRRRNDSPEMGLVPVEDVKQCLSSWIKGGCRRPNGEPCFGDDKLIHHDDHTKLIWGIVHAVGSDQAPDLIEEMGIVDLCSPSMKLRKIVADYRQDRERSAADGGQSITWEALDHVLGVRGAASLGHFETHEIMNAPPRHAQAAEAASAKQKGEGGLEDFDVADEKDDSGLGSLEESESSNGNGAVHAEAKVATGKDDEVRAFGEVPGRPDSEVVKILKRYWATNKAGSEFLKPVYNIHTGDLDRVLRFNLESFNEELRLSAGVVGRDERKLLLHLLKKHRTIDLEAPCFHLPPGVRTVGQDGVHALNTSRIKAMLPASLSEAAFKDLVRKFGSVKCDVNDTGTGDAKARNKQREKILRDHRVFYQAGGFTGESFGVVKWGEEFPQIAATIEGGYGPIEQLQPGGLSLNSEAYKAIGKEYLDCQYLDRVLTFLHHWWTGALGWHPHQGLCVILVGDANAGKGWFIDHLMGRALGGVCQAESAFAGKDQFNEADLLRGSVWALHDITVSGAALAKLTASVKQFVATNWMRLRGIRKDSSTFEAPGARVCQSANYEDMDSLPHTYASVLDKLLVIELLSSLGKGWHGEPLPFPVFEAMLLELPHFLAWLLYEFRPKPELLGKRFGVRAFFRGHLMQAVLDAREENDLAPVLEDLRARVLNGALDEWQEGWIDLSQKLGVTRRQDGSLWLCLRRGAIQEFCRKRCEWMPARDIKEAIKILLKTEDSILVDPRSFSKQKDRGSPKFRVRSTMEELELEQEGRARARDINSTAVFAMIQLTESDEFPI